MSGQDFEGNSIGVVSGPVEKQQIYIIASGGPPEPPLTPQPPPPPDPERRALHQKWQIETAEAREFRRATGLDVEGLERELLLRLHSKGVSNRDLRHMWRKTLLERDGQLVIKPERWRMWVGWGAFSVCLMTALPFLIVYAATPPANHPLMALSALFIGGVFVIAGVSALVMTIRPLHAARRAQRGVEMVNAELLR